MASIDLLRMSQGQLPDAGREDCYIGEGIFKDIERPFTVVDMLADEVERILRKIYSPPLRIIVKFSQAGDTDRDLKQLIGDSWTIEIRCREWWSHSRTEKTDNRFGYTVVSNHGIYVLGSVNTGSVLSPEFPIEHPKMLEMFLSRFHELVTRKMESIAGVMESSASVSKDGSIFAERVENLSNAIVLFDHRYLRHMYDEGYDDYSLPPPDMLTLGGNEYGLRVHYLKDWYGKPDPGWHEINSEPDWKGIER